MNTITLYRYTWGFGKTDEVLYRAIPIDSEDIRLGMVPIDEIEVEVPDVDPVVFDAAAKRGRAQYRVAQRINEQEKAA